MWTVSQLLNIAVQHAFSYGLGAHIPDFSVEVEFFDYLYLGIFIILSPAFDNRFYDNPPANLVGEVAHAVRHFYHLFHVFSTRFIVDLGGEVVALSYVVDRMLAEFAAAAVNFSRAIEDSYCNEGDDDDEDGDVIASSLFAASIEGILKDSHCEVFSFYSRCLLRGHKHFTWTGPKLRIHRASQDIFAILPLLSPGERTDLFSCPIYSENLDPEPPLSPEVLPVVGKRRDQDTPSPSDKMSRKRKRLL
jgi:hypothetical protein